MKKIFLTIKEIEKLQQVKKSKFEQYALDVVKLYKYIQLSEYKKSQEIFYKVIEDFIFDDMTLNLLIKSSFLLGETKMIAEICKANIEKILKLDDNYFYITVLKKCYESKRNQEDDKFDELFKAAKDDIDISFIYYIKYISCKDNQFFLIKSYDKCELSIEVIKEMLRNNLNVKDESIKLLMKTDVHYFEKLKFTNTKRKLDLKVLPVSGGNTIGGSCYFIIFKDLKILVDCGVIFTRGDITDYPDFSKVKEDYPDIFKELDYFFVTHGHLDHCGGILKVYKENPKIRILVTEESREIIRVNIRSKDLNTDDALALERLLSQAVIVPYRKALNITTRGDLVIEFFRAGHILGATSIYIHYNGCGIFVTGDYSLFDQYTVRGMDIPKGYRIDVLITENTYGNINSNLKPRKLEEEEFIYFVRKSLKEGKKILLPSFAIGRAQEIAEILKKELIYSDNERVYIDGMVLLINKIYERFSKFKIDKQNVYEFDRSMYETRDDFILQEVLNNKSCVIASSGMLKSGSAAIDYIKHFLAREDCVCILTGYQAEDTVGKELKEQISVDTKKYINIDNNLIRIKADLKEFNLSAHCSMSEILTLVAYLKPMNVILVHGSSQKQSDIFTILESNKSINTYQSKDQEYIEL